jgi:hypothetical protein
MATGTPYGSLDDCSRGRGLAVAVLVAQGPEYFASTAAKYSGRYGLSLSRMVSDAIPSGPSRCRAGQGLPSLEGTRTAAFTV